MKIGHWGTIVINPGTIIGINFNIAQGCLVGNSQGKHAGTPIIENNVVMGANSIIVGGGAYWEQCFDCSWVFCKFRCA